MKNTALLFVTVIILALTPAVVAQQQPAKSNDGHLGTWQLVSTKYGDQKDMSDYPKERRRVKMITATHFIWVDYDTTTKKIAASAGGPYTLRDGAYTETIEFVGDSMEPYLGKKQVFTIRVEGDRLFQSGQLSDGLKIEEVWQRAQGKGGDGAAEDRSASPPSYTGQPTKATPQGVSPATAPPNPKPSER
jgi:hypothetical protein